MASKAAYLQTGMYLEVAGVVFALLAAVPGIVDFFLIVPPKSSGKKRAAKHGIINVILLIIFAAVWFYRISESASLYIILIAEATGVILLGISGWLGGTLMHRNQIGIDHRYAGAGKWKEKYLGNQIGEIEIAGTEELELNQMMLIHINDNRVVLGKTEDGYVAFDDRCTHRGGTLADGVMICGTVHCPWHGSQFDCKTGTVKAGPAKEPIEVYMLKEREEKLYLNLNS